MSEPLFPSYIRGTAHYSQVGNYHIELVNVPHPVALPKTDDDIKGAVTPFVLIIRPTGKMDEAAFQSVRQAIGENNFVVRRFFEQRNGSPEQTMTIQVAARDISRFIQACIDAEFAAENMHNIQRQYQDYYGSKKPVRTEKHQVAQVVTVRHIESQPTTVISNPLAEAAHTAAELRARARWRVPAGAHA